MKLFLIIFKLLVSSALIGWLVYQNGWENVLNSLLLVPWQVFIGATLLYCIAQIVSSLRWHWICQSLTIKASFFQLLKLYFLGMYFNLFLPTGVGGDVVKSLQLAKQSQQPLSAAYSIVFDRISGLIALVWLALAAAWLVETQIAWLRPGLLTAGLASLAGVLLLPAVLKFFAGWFPVLVPYLHPINTLYQNNYRCLGLLLLAVIIQAIGIGIVYLLGISLHINLPIEYFAISWGLINVATLLPVSINGIGVRETGFVLLFGQFGVSSELAFSLGLLTFLVALCASLLGVLPFVYGINSKH